MGESGWNVKWVSQKALARKYNILFVILKLFNYIWNNTKIIKITNVKCSCVQCTEVITETRENIY